MNHTKVAKKHPSNTCERCSQATICLLSHSEQKQSALFDVFEFPSRILKRGEHLCYQGEQSDNLYIIRTGILKSTITKRNGEEYIMGFYFPPDLFGWEGIDETHRSISIEALDHSNICVIPTDKMFALTQKIPALGAQLLKMVSRRIHQDNVALLRTTAQQRVATFFLQLELRYRQLGFPKQSLQLLMTYQDIANYLRITPSTISRIFHEWEQKKIINIQKYVIQLLNTDALCMMAEYE